MNGFRWGTVHSSDLGIVLRDRSIGLIPDTRDLEVTIPGRAGVYDYRTEHDKRRLTLELLVLAPDSTTLAERLRALANLMDPTSGYQALVFDDEPEREYRVKVTGQAEVEYGHGWATVQLSLKMADPFIYAVTDTVVQADLFSGSSTQVQNDGTAPTPVVVTVEVAGVVGQPLSPASGVGTVYTESVALLNPRVSIGGVEFAWAGQVQAGQQLVVDTRAMTVLLDGTNALGGWSGDFPLLTPGLNEVAYRDDVGGLARLTLRFRRRWT